MLVSNASYYAESVRSLLEEESDADSTNLSLGVLQPPVHVYMAGPGASDAEVDPFSTPVANSARGRSSPPGARRREEEGTRRAQPLPPRARVCGARLPVPRPPFSTAV